MTHYTSWVNSAATMICASESTASCALYLARARDSDTVPVKQQPRHKHGMVRRQTSPVAPLVAGVNGSQIQLVHHVPYEARQVTLRQPILQRWRQQERLIMTASAKAFVHNAILQKLPPPET